MGFLSGILSVFAGALSAYSAVESRRENKKAARQADVAADLQAKQKRSELDRLRSKQRTAYARAGVKLDGTPTAVIEDSQEQGQLDIDLIKLNGSNQADVFKSRARSAGFNALIGGAGTTAGLFGKDRSGVSLVSRLF